MICMAFGQRALLPCAALVLASVLNTPSVSAQEEDADLRTALRMIAPEVAADVDDHGFPAVEEAKVELGKMLFWDKILSGNMDTSCATCHHALAATGDGLSLSVGQAGRGVGITRSAADVAERVPRNAPHVFNLGAIEFTRMFHDGRVEQLPDGSFISPAGPDLPPGLDNALAAQAMFPVTSTTEMAGDPGDNPIADAATAEKLPEVWKRLAARLRATPGYIMLFMDAFEDIQGPTDITFVHAANAIAAYEAAAFRADNSPYDRWLDGDRRALSPSARQGLKVFQSQCTECHSGRFQTNHEFRAICMPQIGPGKGDDQPGYKDGADDFGRERVTGLREDRFRFRVPSLRNVALTGPWGHDGAYNTLEAVVRHHLDPVGSLNTYDTSQAVLPPNPALPDDFVVQNDPGRRAGIGKGNDLSPRSVSDRDLAHLLEFLHALTDPASLDLRDTVPVEVPSGLPVFD